MTRTIEPLGATDHIITASSSSFVFLGFRIPQLPPQWSSHVPVVSQFCCRVYWFGARGLWPGRNRNKCARFARWKIDRYSVRLRVNGTTPAHALFLCRHSLHKLGSRTKSNRLAQATLSEQTRWHVGCVTGITQLSYRNCLRQTSLSTSLQLLILLFARYL